eukprot:UN03699
MGCGAASLPTIITILTQTQILLDNANSTANNKQYNNIDSSSTDNIQGDTDVNKKQQHQQHQRRVINIDFTDMNDTILNTSYDNIVNMITRYITTPCEVHSARVNCDYNAVDDVDNNNNHINQEEKE